MSLQECLSYFPVEYTASQPRIVVHLLQEIGELFGRDMKHAG